MSLNDFKDGEEASSYCCHIICQNRPVMCQAIDLYFVQEEFQEPVTRHTLADHIKETLLRVCNKISMILVNPVQKQNSYRKNVKSFLQLSFAHFIQTTISQRRR